MLELIVIGLLTYYGFLFVFFYKCSLKKLWKDYFPSKDTIQPEIKKPEITIILTKEIITDPQKGTIPLKKGQEIAKTDGADIFAATTGVNEEIKVDYGYVPEEYAEEEEIPEWEEVPEGYASGVTFDEIKLVVGVITDKQKEKEKEAVEIIQRLQYTELYNQIIDQIQAGEERVNKLMDKYLDTAEMPGMVINSELPESENFDINNYLPDENKNF